MANPEVNLGTGTLDRDYWARLVDRYSIRSAGCTGAAKTISHFKFLINEVEQANINQLIDAVIRDSYCIVQEYLPAAVEGDVRLFVMNSRALRYQDQYAAFRRVNKSGDARSNMHSGGESVPAEVTDQMLELVEIVRPKLIRDGMFLVGLDIVDDKLMEINVFSPGGLGSAQQHTGVDFTEAIIQDLERKVKYKS